MPRKDPTFSSDDLIRIWTVNLTSTEKAEVEAFFQGGGQEIVNELLDIISAVLGIIPLVGELFEVIGIVVDVVQLQAALNANVERLETLRRLFPEEVR